MKVERELPSREAYDLLELVTDIADKELEPRVTEFEDKGRFPREVFGLLGEVGLLTLPFGEDIGGGVSPTRSTSRCWRRSPRAGPPSPSA